MLRISKLADYALLVMSQMAKTPGAVLSATELAEALHLNTPTISKVLKMLGDAQLVNSVRGAEGGYHLAREPHKITVAEIIKAIEGDLAVTECCHSRGRCAIDSLCMMRENWIKINQMIGGLLDRVTILDMLKPLSIQGLS